MTDQRSGRGWHAGLAAVLIGDGIAAGGGPPPAGAFVMAAVGCSGDAHLTVLTGTPRDRNGPGQ